MGTSAAVDRRVIGLAVAIAALSVGVVIVVSRDGGTDGTAATSTSVPTTTSASATTAPPHVDAEWNAALEAALSPLPAALTELAAGVDEWSRGERDGAALAVLLDRIEPALDGVRDDVASLPPHPTDPLAGELVATTAELYVRAVDAHRAALAVSDADAATQYDRLGRRLRILGDRVFDRARERTAAPFEPDPGVRLVLPAEVPDWDRLELSAGPPLEAADSDRTDEVPLEREDARASQTEEAWLAAVRDLGAPTSADLRAAFGDAGTLGDVARRLVAAAEELRVVPVPDGDRNRADRVAIGWLLMADGARAAQLEAISGQGVGIADALVTLADGTAFAPAPA